MKNIGIRLIVSEYGLKYKDIAAEMDTTPTYLSYLLRNDLNEKHKQRIMKAIQALKERAS